MCRSEAVWIKTELDLGSIAGILEALHRSLILASLVMVLILDILTVHS